MKYLIVLIFFSIFLIPQVFAQQDTNPSVILHTEEIPWYEFNVVSREAKIVELNDIHKISWQVTIDNNLLYDNGDAVLRLYDDLIPENFIEVGMGGPPDNKFWVAVKVPDEGYVVIRRSLEKGWIPEARTIVSYTDTAGMTINNGERIVVTNLDIGQFAIDSYSVHGLQGSTDPPSVYSGFMIVEFLSGDPAENVFHLMPFAVTAVVGGLAAILFLTKKRSS